MTSDDGSRGQERQVECCRDGSVASVSEERDLGDREGKQERIAHFP